MRGPEKDGPRVVVYTAAHPLSRPATAFRTWLRALSDARVTAWALARRKLFGRYRQSLLGPLLVLLPPVLIALWCVLAQQARVLVVGELEIPYSLFVLINLTLWTSFLECIRAPMESLEQDRPLLTEAHVSTEALILSSLMVIVCDLGFKLLPVVLLAAVSGVAPAWGVLPALALVALLLLLGAVVGMVLAPFNLLFKEISTTFYGGMMLWIFLTPVFFPRPASGVLHTVLGLNPVTHLLEAIQALAFGFGQASLGIVAGIAVATLLLGIAAAIFLKAGVAIALERLGS